MNDVKNQETGIMETLVQAVIVSLDLEEKALLYNSNKKPYRWVPVKVAHQDGSSETTSAMLYENSRIANEDKFVVGATVEVAISHDTFIGKLNLGSSRFNLSAIKGKAQQATTTVAEKPKGEEIEAEA